MATKPVVLNVTSGSQYDAATFNDNFETLRDAIADCLGRGGTDENPNSMSGDLDMDLNKIQNLAICTAAKDAANKEYVDGRLSFISSASPVIVSSPQVLLSSYASFAAALTAIGSSPAWLMIDTAGTVAANATVPATLILDFTPGSVLTVNSGVTLTINGRIIAGKQQIFAGTGAVTGLEYARPQWFGARVDGTTDDYVAIQNALKAVTLRKGKVFLSPGTYGVRHYVKMPNNVEMYGVREGSIIRNLGGVGNENSCIRLGGYGNLLSDGVTSSQGDPPLKETFYSAVDGKMGERRVELTTHEDAANFVVGDIVFLKTDAQFTSAIVIPELYMINRVEAVDVANGYVFLKYALKHDFTTWKIARQTGTLDDLRGEPALVAENVHIHDLTLAQDVFGYSAISGGCMFECLIERINFAGVTKAISANGFSHSAVHDVRGTARFSAVDFALWSSDYLASEIRIARIDGQTTASSFFSLGEASHDFTVENCIIDGGTNSVDITTPQSPVAFGIGTHSATFRNNVVTCANANTLLGLGVGTVTYDSHDIVIENNKFMLNAANVYGIRNFSLGTGNIIRGNQFFGTTTDGRCITLESSVRDCIVENNVMPLGFVTCNVTDKTANTIRNNITKYYHGVQNLSAYSNTTYTTGLEITKYTFALAAGETGGTPYYHVRASGAVAEGATTHGNKILKLKASTSVLETITFATGEVGSWEFDAWIHCTSITTEIVSCKLVKSITGGASTVTVTSFGLSINRATTACDITLTGQITGSDDSIQYREWIVTPYNEDVY